MEGAMIPIPNDQDLHLLAHIESCGQIAMVKLTCGKNLSPTTKILGQDILENGINSVYTFNGRIAMFLYGSMLHAINSPNH